MRHAIRFPLDALYRIFPSKVDMQHIAGLGKHRANRIGWRPVFLELSRIFPGTPSSQYPRSDSRIAEWHLPSNLIVGIFRTCPATAGSRLQDPAVGICRDWYPSGASSNSMRNLSSDSLSRSCRCLRLPLAHQQQAYSRKDGRRVDRQDRQRDGTDDFDIIWIG